MSIKNAPLKWNEITIAARACGAGDWAMRKWLERRQIPAEWKLKIIEQTAGRIGIHDMDIQSAAAERENV